MISQLAKFLVLSCIIICPSGNDVTNTTISNQTTANPDVVTNSTSYNISTAAENSTLTEPSSTEKATFIATTNSPIINETTSAFSPTTKNNRKKIILVILAIAVVVAIIAVIYCGKRHCCNTMKTNITTKFNVKKDSELEYIIDDGEFMNPDDPPVLAEMKVAPNGKRKKAKKEETLNSLSGKNKDGSLQLYGATTSAALPC